MNNLNDNLNQLGHPKLQLVFYTTTYHPHTQEAYHQGSKRSQRPKPFIPCQCGNDGKCSHYYHQRNDKSHNQGTYSHLLCLNDANSFAHRVICNISIGNIDCHGLTFCCNAMCGNLACLTSRLSGNADLHVAIVDADDCSFVTNLVMLHEPWLFRLRY